MLVYKYKLFKIEPSENITDIFTRFIDIINDLKVLARSTLIAKFFHKILKSLSKNWEAQMTTIQGAKDLN